MNARIASDTDQTRAAAHSLVEQRAQLQAWLVRLDEHGSEMPDHVVARVRDDYLRRLDQVTNDLAGHLDSLRQELLRLNDELEAAHSRHAAAVDALAELRLRHMIGELPDDEWSRRFPELEQAVADGERQSEALAAETARLDELVGSVASAAEPTAPVAADAAAAADDERFYDTLDEQVEAAADEPLGLDGRIGIEVSVEVGGEIDAGSEPTTREEMGVLETAMEADDAGDAPAEDVDAAVEGIFAGWSVERGPVDDSEELPWLGADATDAAANPADIGFDELEFLREVTEPAADGAAPAADAGGDDMAFLEELDRAIAASSAAGGGAPAAEPEPETVAAEPEPSAAARATLLCKECGASNDARAWYCEICGMELTT